MVAFIPTTLPPAPRRMSIGARAVYQTAPMSELVWEREWPGRTSILVVAFAGYFDAASAATGAVDHLIEFTDATRLASIDGDAFFDAQQVRPQVVLEDGVTRSIIWPENTVHANDQSDAGRELVLLSGIEPHYHWRQFTGLLIEVAQQTGAQVVSRSAPCLRRCRTAACRSCTRRRRIRRSRSGSACTGRATRASPASSARCRPSSTISLVPAISMQVGVPYYAAGTQNWKASAALLRNLEHVTGIPTGHSALQERVAEWEQLVDDAVAENPEASGYLPAARGGVRPSGRRSSCRRPTTSPRSSSATCASSTTHRA